MGNPGGGRFKKRSKHNGRRKRLAALKRASAGARPKPLADAMKTPSSTLADAAKERADMTMSEVFTQLGISGGSRAE